MLKYGTAVVLYYKVLKKVRVRCDWGLLLFKKQELFKNQKQGMAGVLIYLNCWNKIRLGSSIVYKAKIRYGWSFNLFTMLKSRIARVLYCRKYQNKVPLRYSWDLLLFKNQKEGTAVVSIYLKFWNKVPLRSHIVENAKLRYG